MDLTDSKKGAKNLWKLKDRLEDVPPGCRLIHERLKLKKLKSTQIHFGVKDEI
jgi:hypothetical protein